MQSWLAHYPNKEAAQLLESGFTHGFRLGFMGPRLARDSHCLISASERPDITLTKLQKEIDLGRIAGPFANRPFPSLQCSPIGLVPKHEPNEFRLIQHLSFPQGQSINDFISKDSCSVNYASFDSAVDLVMASGPGGGSQSQISSQRFAFFPFHHWITNCSALNFKGNSILTSVCQWVAPVHVRCLRPLALS